jgi:hypothetical protein
MENFFATLVPLLGCTAAAGFVAWMAMVWWQSGPGHATLALRIGEVFVPALAATAAYFGAAIAFKIPSAAEMLELFVNRLRKS